MVDRGMIFVTQAVACSMLASCESDTCGAPGFDVLATSDAIASLAVSDVACQGVNPSCTAMDDAGTCAKFYVVPVASGNCHVDVTLMKGTTFSTDVKIVSGSGSCQGFFPAAIGDQMIEVP